MAEITSTLQTSGPTANDCYRVCLRRGSHHWAFVFAPADADPMIKRVDELSRDPSAPLADTDAQALIREINHARRHAPHP